MLNIPSFCMSYLKGYQDKKALLKDQYNIHTAEKEKVRKLKEECKQESIHEKTVLCSNSDLQQVIYLPISMIVQYFTTRGSLATT